jgi:hypothetical protein
LGRSARQCIRLFKKATQIPKLDIPFKTKSDMNQKKLSNFSKKNRQDHLNTEAAQAGLDHHWVTRWLDDVGLPQYKDTFFDARVDGRVLNVLTVEDLLCHLKITNLLHHLSLRTGIQVIVFYFSNGAYVCFCFVLSHVPGDRR